MLDKNIDRNKLLYLIGSILVVVILILIFIFVKNDNKDLETTDKNNVIVPLSNYKDVTVKSVMQNGDEYKLVVRTEVGKTGIVDVFVLKNDKEIGKSEYASVPIEAIELDFQKVFISESQSLEVNTEINTETNTEAGTETSTETSTEVSTEASTEESTEASTEASTEESPIEESVPITTVDTNNYIGFEDIASKAVEEGTLYQTDLDTNIQFVNSLLSDGYELNTQISTSVYNDLYLIGQDNNLRIVIALNKPLMIISEMEEIDVDIYSILNIYQEGEG